MSIGVAMSIALAVLVLASPVVILIWARSATMFSGEAIPRYDGPLPASDELSADPSAGQLSPEEVAAWEGLTKVSWNMPHQNG